MDALTDILNSLRLKGGIYFQCLFSGPWGMNIEKTSVAEFHIITRGNCWLKLKDEEKLICLEAGDVVVFPHGQAHVLLDSPDGVALPVEDVIGNQQVEGYGPVIYGSGGVSVNILCGYFEFDSRVHSPLIDALPMFIHIKGADATELSWLQTTINFICYETKEPRNGTQAVVNRLVEVMFIQIMRAYFVRSTQLSGILAALADSKVGLALNAIHQHPEKDWTLEMLAKFAGMSRTAFSKRFHELAKVTPMHYLTMWRMQKAKDALLSTNSNIQVIAENIGYQSEASFSKVFKKYIGNSPGAYRRMAVKEN